MTPSAELLAARETTVSAGPGALFMLLPWFSGEAYCLLREQTQGAVMDWVWAHAHLEVVEMIERAAVCALKDEGRI